MRREHYEPYRFLQDNGINVRKERMPPMNAGGESETPKHVVAKNLFAYVAARDYGYMTDIECETPNGEIDVLLWGLPDRLTYAVECETSPTQETKDDKFNRYVKQLDPVDDMVWVNLSNFPLELPEQIEFIQGKL